MKLTQEQLGALEQFRNSGGLSCSDLADPGVVETLMTLAELACGLEQQLEAARNELEAIVDTTGQDRGVVLLSWDSPTHYDVKRGCQVYDHENFSPLGDALIKLHGLLSVEK